MKLDTALGRFRTIIELRLPGWKDYLPIQASARSRKGTDPGIDGVIPHCRRASVGDASSARSAFVTISAWAAPAQVGSD